jgi:hypothetical protein
MACRLALMWPGAPNRLLFVGVALAAKLLLIRNFSRIKQNAAPAAPTGAYKPTDAIASSLLRDSAALKERQGLLPGVHSAYAATELAHELGIYAAVFSHLRITA